MPGLLQHGTSAHSMPRCGRRIHRGAARRVDGECWSALQTRPASTGVPATMNGRDRRRNRRRPVHANPAPRSVPNGRAGEKRNGTNGARAPCPATVQSADDRTPLAHGDVEQPGTCAPSIAPPKRVFPRFSNTRAMHQETLLYMWHRLPVRTEAGGPPGTRLWSPDARPRPSGLTSPAGSATLGRRSRVDSVRMGQRVSLVSCGRRAVFRSSADDVTRPSRFLGIRRSGRIRRSANGGCPADWEWIKSEGIAHPLFWERLGDRWHWRGMFRVDSVTGRHGPGVTVSQAEASAVRPAGVMARLPTEAEFMGAAAYGDGSARWAAAAPARPCSDFHQLGIPSRPAATRTNARRASESRDLIGNGLGSGPKHAVRGRSPASRRRRRIRNTPPDFFDGEQPFVHEGRVRRPPLVSSWRPGFFRNWFRARLSVRLRHVPLRRGITHERVEACRSKTGAVGRLGRSVRGRRPSTTWNAAAAPAAVAGTSTMPSDRRCSTRILPAARGIASRRAEGRVCWPAHARDIFDPAAWTPHRRARRRPTAEKTDDAGGVRTPYGPVRPLDLAAHRRLRQRARRSSGGARRSVRSTR